MNMTTEDTSRTLKPSELSLSEEVQEARDICQSLHSADLTTLMQAVKTAACMLLWQRGTA